MISGSALVSTIATPGIPSRRASLTAFCSRVVSMTTSASGNCAISRMPTKFRRPAKLLHRFIKIDDINLVALLEDERLHLRVPALGLVTEVHAGFKKLG